MKKWLWLVAAVMIALVAYTAAGPYLTVRAIRSAVKAQDAEALAEQVDFPALRGSFKVQVADRLARETGIDARSGPFAALGLSLANGLVGGMVDAMATPRGLGAIMEGSKVWDRATNVSPPTDEDAPPRAEPLHDARYRYESPSRFTATVQDQRGRPVVLVMTRHGLRWKLSDIRLPL
jgi:hypothetical protein